MALHYGGDAGSAKADKPIAPWAREAGRATFGVANAVNNGSYGLYEVLLVAAGNIS